MAFGVYIHIPYCIQRCSYCDFATYEESKILPKWDYVELLCQEISARSRNLAPAHLDTVYFGGGTPSLLSPEQIVTILQALENAGLQRSPGKEQRLATEVTMEVNPATLTEKDLDALLASGVNRFSVGAQSFDDRLLKSVRREHSAQQTGETLNLLKSKGLNFSADLLFGLPTQDEKILEKDIAALLAFDPAHISPYCLTVPEAHPLRRNQPTDEVQIQMFKIIDQALTQAGYQRYEISNYCKPGFESRHNRLYWEDDSYLGLGLSAHSYLPGQEWGTRFWNTRNIDEYTSFVKKHCQSPWENSTERLPGEQKELLAPYESLTDFCHTALRQMRGLSEQKLANKFGDKALRLTAGPLKQMLAEGLVERDSEGTWRLTNEGVFLSNSVFRSLTFLAEEWDSLT